MITLSFMVNGQSLYRTDKNEVATDSLNAVEAEFTVDKEWDGTTKIAEFQNGDVLITSPVIVSNPGYRLVAKVPAEVLANPGVLYVGLRGTKGTGSSAVRLTTVRRASVIVMSSTYAADYTPAEPHSLSEFEEMFQKYAAECTGAKISEISVNGVTITFTYADGTEKSATLDLSLFLRKSEANDTYQTLSNLSQIIPSVRQSTTKYPSENAVAAYVAEAVSDKADADSVYTKDETYSQEETDGLLQTVYNNARSLYVAKDQGTANAGKYLVVGNAGSVIPSNPPTGEDVLLDNAAFTIIEAHNAQEAAEALEDLIELKTAGVQTIANLFKDITEDAPPAAISYPSVYAVQQYVKNTIGDINAALEALL